MKTNSKGQFVSVPLADRFWDKVNKSGPSHPTNPALGRCWIWTGATHEYGYGLIWDEKHRRQLRAHRIAWKMKNGPIPKGKQILHSCDNPPCVNPEHTYPGTSVENHADMISRGRALNGERNPQARLTEAQVLNIRSRYPLANRTGPRTERDRRMILSLCKKYKISQRLAYRVASGHRWKYLTR